MKIFGKTIWRKNKTQRNIDVSRFEDSVHRCIRQKYVDLINMHLNTMSEEDMLKLLVILVETKKSRVDLNVKQPPEEMFNNTNLKFKL